MFIIEVLFFSMSDRGHTISLGRKLFAIILLKILALLFLLFYIMPPSERPNPRNEFGSTKPIDVNVVGQSIQQ